MSAINDSLQQRMIQLEREEEQKNFLFLTDLRAEQRKKDFEKRMDEAYGPEWRDKDKPNTQFEKFYQAGLKNLVKHKQPFASHYKLSGTAIGQYIPSIHYYPVDQSKDRVEKEKSKSPDTETRRSRGKQSVERPKSAQETIHGQKRFQVFFPKWKIKGSNIASAIEVKERASKRR